jgi:hypothetical protein
VKNNVKGGVKGGGKGVKSDVKSDVKSEVKKGVRKREAWCTHRDLSRCNSRSFYAIFFHDFLHAVFTYRRLTARIGIPSCVR